MTPIAYRALLLAHAPLVALVNAVAMNGVPQGTQPAFVVFGYEGTLDHTLDDFPISETRTFETVAWTENAEDAFEVAAAIEAAIAGSGCVVRSKRADIHPELGLAYVTLGVEFLQTFNLPA